MNDEFTALPGPGAALVSPLPATTDYDGTPFVDGSLDTKFVLPAWDGTGPYPFGFPRIMYRIPPGSVPVNTAFFEQEEATPTPGGVLAIEFGWRYKATSDTYFQWDFLRVGGDPEGVGMAGSTPFPATVDWNVRTITFNVVTERVIASDLGDITEYAALYTNWEAIAAGGIAKEENLGLRLDFSASDGFELADVLITWRFGGTNADGVLDAKRRTFDP